MNPQTATHQQASYPNSQPQQPQQPQQGTQQRQMPNTLHSGTQGHQQQAQSPYANFDPRLTFWSLEKPKNADSWADVKPQQQHISLEELQDELETFKRKDLTVKRVLDEVKSLNCRKQINNLADDQTKELQKSNRTVKYIIGGILLEWRYIDRRRKEKILNRVQVILQTVPSGIVEVQSSRPAGGTGSANGNAQGPHSLKQPSMTPGQQYHGNTQGQGPNMAHQPRTIPQQGQQHMGQSQFDLRPPPPSGQGQTFGGGTTTHAPPGGHQVHGHGDRGAPPPPPPPPIGGGGQNHGQYNPQVNVMPGTYPDSVPMKGMRHGMSGVETVDPQFMHGRKPRHKVHRRMSSTEESNHWDTETGSSGSDSYHVRSVEGDFGLVDDGRRGRSKRSKHMTKTRRHKSQSRVRSRSIRKGHQRQHPRRRGSGSSNSRTGRHSPTSPKAKSPYNSSSDEGRHSHKKHKYKVRSGVSSTGAYNNKGFEKFASSPTMSRHSSQKSWSDVTSSSHFGDRDKHDRRHDHTRAHLHTLYHHDRSNRAKYEDPDRSGFANRRSFADDYPYDIRSSRDHDQYGNEEPCTDRPPSHRRTTTQVPLPNPLFTTPDAPLRQNREPAYSAYPVDTNMRKHQLFQEPQRYTTHHSSVEQDRFGMDDIVDALYDRIAKKGEAQRMPPLGRHHTERHSGFFDDEGSQRMPPLRRHQTEGRRSFITNADDWDRKYPPRGVPPGSYGCYGF
jgi:hypothetical protein